MDTIEDIMDNDYEDTENDMVEELHRKLKKMEERRSQDLMEEKYTKINEHEDENLEEIDEDEMYGDADLVKVL